MAITSKSKSKSKNKSKNNNNSKSKNTKRTTYTTKIKQPKKLTKLYVNNFTTKHNIFINYIDNNIQKLLKNKLITSNIGNTGNTGNTNIFHKYLFNDDDNKLNCICENIYKKHIADTCKCNKLKTYSSQGRSGSSIHSILCKINTKTQKSYANNFNTSSETDIEQEQQEEQILKTTQLYNYDIILKAETNKYIFIELDGFIIQTLITNYIYNELPFNTVNILSSGVCDKKEYNASNKYLLYFKNNIDGFNLMEKANLGTGLEFIINIITKTYDNIFNITSEQERYLIVCNFLLQCILIIGHLQTCKLELLHGDYKPNNVFVSKCSIDKVKEYKFNIAGTIIKVKNLGFAVLIADFDKSSITLKSNSNLSNKQDKKDKKDKKDSRITPIINFKPLIHNYVKNIINKYGDIDPTTYNNGNGVLFNTILINKILPKKLNITHMILRSAGIKFYRDVDLYMFFILLLNNQLIKNYCITYKLDTTIMSFMSMEFKSLLFKLPTTKIRSGESGYYLIKILTDINEPMPIIFKNKNKYIDMLVMLSKL